MKNVPAILILAALASTALAPLSASAQQYCGYSGPSYIQLIYGSGAEPCGTPNDAVGYYYPNYAPVYYVQRPYYTSAGPTASNYGYGYGQSYGYQTAQPSRSTQPSYGYQQQPMNSYQQPTQTNTYYNPYTYAYSYMPQIYFYNY